MAVSPRLQAAIAAHRFGLGEADLDVVGRDAEGWLAAQIGPADPAAAAAARHAGARCASSPRSARSGSWRSNPPPGMTAEQVVAGHYRETLIADARSRLATPRRRSGRSPSGCSGSGPTTSRLGPQGLDARLVGAFERDAIRPNIAGRFETLLVAATTHPAMLRYLDNWLSAGPHSRVVALEARRAARRRGGARVSGLNENLAREILELHTLGADSGRGPEGPRGGYTQADVTSFAAVLTGWRPAGLEGGRGQPFDPAWHEPGRKTVLGKSYPEGPEALPQVLHDLARHPSTARFIATKLARHFAADDPPPELVDTLAAAYRRSDGQLAEVYRELVKSPLAWNPAPAKLKTPEEFVVSTVRLLGASDRIGERGEFARLAAGIVAQGQRIHATPSPAGWPDRAEEWLGPEAVWKRVEWATRVADRAGRLVDAPRAGTRQPRPDARRRIAAPDRTRGRWPAGLGAAADGPRVPAPLMRTEEAMDKSFNPQRRRLMGAALCAGAAAPWTSLSFAGNDTAASGNRFVMVVLRGGMDGLGAAPAIGDCRLRRRARPARPVPDAAAAASTRPSRSTRASSSCTRCSASARRRSSTRSGLPYRERSHFDAQQVLESGGTRPYELSTGWLGRAPRRDRQQGARPSTRRCRSCCAAAPTSNLGASCCPIPSADLGRPPRADVRRRSRALATALERGAPAAAPTRRVDCRTARRRRWRRNGRGPARSSRCRGAPPSSSPSRTARRPRCSRSAAGTRTPTRRTRTGRSPRACASSTSAWPRCADGLVAARRMAAHRDRRRQRVRPRGRGQRHPRHRPRHGGVAFVLGGAVQGGRVVADWPGLAKKASATKDATCASRPTCARCSRACSATTCRIASRSLDGRGLPDSAKVRPLCLLA
jgi:uncharacterized protein (DUF1800 family)